MLKNVVALFNISQKTKKNTKVDSCNMTFHTIGAKILTCLCWFTLGNAVLQVCCICKCYICSLKVTLLWLHWRCVWGWCGIRILEVYVAIVLQVNDTQWAVLTFQGLHLIRPVLCGIVCYCGSYNVSWQMWLCKI